MTNWDPIDTVMTPWREKIHRLMSADLKVGASEGGFGCAFEFDGDGHHGCSGCGDLAEGRKGDWAYVGAQYGEARVSGKKARILFVSMDRSRMEWDPAHWTFLDVQKQYRSSAFARTQKGGNPHMRGTDCELECLLDNDVSPTDRCQQFALVNAVLCGRPAPEGTSTASVATREMKINCRKQGERIVRALDPDIVIAQGLNHARNLCRSFMSGSVHQWPDKGSPEVARGQINRRSAWFLLTSHPGWYTRTFAGPRQCRFRNTDDMASELKEAIQMVRDEFSGAVTAGS